jgi:hypothetical protein
MACKEAKSIALFWVSIFEFDSVMIYFLYLLEVIITMVSLPKMTEKEIILIPISLFPLSEI